MRGLSSCLLSGDQHDIVGSMIEKDPPGKSVDGELVALVQRALAGKKDAQKLLCERQLPLFQRVAAKLTYRFRNVTCETARQEELDLLHYIVCAFMEDLQNKQGVVSRWRAEQGPLDAWLRPFATCRGLDSLRKRKDQRNVSLDAMPAAIEADLMYLHSALSQGTADVEHREALRKLCDLITDDPALGPDALQLLERIFWAEEDRELLARSLGMKRNSLDVKVKRMREALLKLGQQLGIPFGRPPKKDE